MGLQIPPTFCISSLKKNPAENYGFPDPANFLHQLPQKESGGKLWGSRSRQLSASAPSKRIQQKMMGLQIPPTFCISSLKKNPAENYGAPDPANFLHQLKKKNPAENYGAPDPANFLHQLKKKNPAENYGAPDPANFLHQPAPSKRIRRKIMGLQIPPTFCISQLPQKESGGKLWVSRSRQLSASAPSKRNPAENYGAPDPANFLHQLKKKNPASQKESAPNYVA
jgi:hypothetical protein